MAEAAAVAATEMTVEMVKASQLGMKALGAGHTDIAWTHLLDPETGRYNTPFIPKYLPGAKTVLVHLFRREIGIVAAPGNPKGIKRFEDLAAPGIRFVNRQAGSGTRILLDCELDKRRIPAVNIAGYDREVFTHIEVGLSILSGDADAGLATVAVSRLMGLHFIPVTREDFERLVAPEPIERAPRALRTAAAAVAGPILLEARLPEVGAILWRDHAGVRALRLDAAADEHLLHAVGRAGTECRGVADDQLAHVDGVEAVHILVGRDGQEDLLRIQMRRQRQLHQDAVHGFVGIELLDEGKEF